jgi:YD repeat-containing protein
MPAYRSWWILVTVIATLSGIAVAGSPFVQATNEPVEELYDPTSAFSLPTGYPTVSSQNVNVAARAMSTQSCPTCWISKYPFALPIRGRYPSQLGIKTGVVAAAPIGNYRANLSLAKKFESPVLSSSDGYLEAGVNTMTGRHSQDITLGAIQASGGASYPLTLRYSAPNPYGFEMDQRMTQSFDAGYGWSIEFPYVVVDHKGTTQAWDDDFYAYLGVWGGGKLVPVTKENGQDVFQLANNPNIEVHYTSASNSLNVAAWVAKFPDGSVMVLGGRSDAVRMTLRRGAKVGLAPDLAQANDAGYIPVQPDFAYRWDVTEIRSPADRGIIQFAWNQKSSNASWLSTTKSFVSESWPSVIWSSFPNFKINPTTEMAEFEQEKIIDKVTLDWGDKTQAEVFAPDVVSGGSYQPGSELQTKYLAKIVFSSENIETKEFDLKYDLSTATVDAVNFVKRLLREVIVANNANSSESDKLKWFMKYDIYTGWLSSVLDPNQNETSYEFHALSQVGSGSNALDPDPFIGNLTLGIGRTYTPSPPPPSAITTLRLSQDFSNSGIIRDESTCAGEFCFVVSRISPISTGNTSCRFGGDIPTCWADPAVLNSGIAIEAYKRSTGGMRKVFSKQFSRSNFIAQNDYFIISDSITNDVSVYQWNGSEFVSNNPFINDPIFASGSPKVYGALLSIEQVIPSGGDYFLVKYKIPTTSGSNGGGWDVIPVVRNIDGSWSSINRSISACDVRNDISYSVDLNTFPAATDYASIMRPNGGQCMEFTPGLPGWSESYFAQLNLTAQPDFFVISHNLWRVNQVYRRLAGGNSFVNETAKMSSGSGAGNLQFQYFPPSGPRLPWTFDGQLHGFGISSGKNYFAMCVAAWNPLNGVISDGKEYIWNWDGIAWTPSLVPNSGFAQLWSLLPSVSPSRDGMMVFNPYAEQAIRTTRNAITYSSRFSFTWFGNVPPIPTTYVYQNSSGGFPIDANIRPRISGQDKYSSIELDDVDANDVTQSDGKNNSFLYYKTRGDITSGLSEGMPNRLYDLIISPNEDWIVGKVQNGSNFDFYYVPLARNAASASAGVIPPKSAWTLLASKPTNGVFPPKITIGPGIWMLTYGDVNGLKSEFHPMYSSGPVARIPWKEFQVVSKVTMKSLYTDRFAKQYKFTYGSGSDVTYNGLTQAPESKVTTVTQYGKDYATPSPVPLNSKTITYLSERLSNPLDGSAPSPASTSNLSNLPSNSQFLAGHVASMVTTSVDGIVSTSTPIYQLRMKGLSTENAGWAQGAFQIAQIGETTSLIDRGSKSTTTTWSGGFDQVSGLPQVSLKLIENSAGEGTQFRHSAQVNTYNSAGKIIASHSALYRARADAKALLLSPTPSTQIALDCTPTNGIVKATPISVSSNEYSSNSIDLLKTYRLGVRTRNVDPNALGTGQVTLPSDFSKAAQELVSTISPFTQVNGGTTSLRSPTGSPLFSQDNTTNITTSFIYEGLRGLPSAIAWNSEPNNIAVLTGEDGALGINGTFDGLWNGQNLGVGQWELGSSTFDVSNPHLGRYSMKLSGPGSQADDYWLFGPTHNVYLKDIANLTNGLTVSAWIYSTGVYPTLGIEQHLANGTGVGGFNAQPVGGAGNFKPNTWQQWKIIIPYSSLIKANGGGGQSLFTADVSGASGDFLRIWIGYNSQATGNIWVDDFVIAPSDANVALQSYDYAGRLIGTLDPDGHAVKTEYGARGEIQAVRDERGRIFGQSSVLSAGEE